VTGGITITNGNTAGHIDVNGQNAIPADMGGTPWAIENTVNPGVDQFLEDTLGSQSNGVGSNNTSLSTAPVCDTAFNVVGVGSPVQPVGDCSATAGQSSNEVLNMVGPSSSTDQNGPFTVTTTWTAVP
jgi:hypothetical protein